MENFLDEEKRRQFPLKIADKVKELFGDLRADH